MSGLVTLLSNSTAYNFKNTLNNFKEINSQHFVQCLEGILSTLERYGMTPIKMRESFIDSTSKLAEYSIITMKKVHKEDELLEALSIYEDELFDTSPQIWDELEKYLIDIRGK